MWISKKKHQREILQLKSESMLKSFDHAAEVLLERDIKDLKKEVKKLKKKVKELRNG
jgi:polyhydroxyalkanoate synthesis regulator phasin